MKAKGRQQSVGKNEDFEFKIGLFVGGVSLKIDVTIAINFDSSFCGWRKQLGMGVGKVNNVGDVSG